MSTKGHNKRRNTGLLYEFLIRTISKALVENDTKKSSSAVKIVKRYFKPGTELHKELRLIMSLVRTTVSSDGVATSIMHESKLAARSYDLHALDREKSFLISAINKSLNDDDFYDQPVNEYRTYATIQTLLNDWRSKDVDIGRVARYEDQLVKWLMTEKVEHNDSVISVDNAGTNRLLMKAMMKRLNEKYAGTMSNEQRNLIRAYAFSTANDDSNSIEKKLVEVKERLLAEIATFIEKNPDNEYVGKKLADARERIVSETLENVDDDTVTRFMLYTKLSSELNGEEL